jgi:AraC-like DNA-binding protein
VILPLCYPHWLNYEYLSLLSMSLASFPRVLLEGQPTALFERQVPAPDLRPYVEGYFQSTARTTRRSYALPNYSALLSFSLQPQPWSSHRPGHSPQWFVGSHVLGPLTHCRTCVYPAGSTLLTVKLRPGALSLLLDQPAPATLNRHASLPTLLPLGALPAQLTAADTLANRVALLEPVLHALFTQRGADFRYQLVQAALARLERAPPASSSLAQVATQLHVTPKSLSRYFTQVVGAPPARVSRLLQFTRALARYQLPGNPFTPEDAGYTDWAHLAHVSRQLTGRRLREL